MYLFWWRQINLYWNKVSATDLHFILPVALEYMQFIIIMTNLFFWMYEYVLWTVISLDLALMEISKNENNN